MAEVSGNAFAVLSLAMASSVLVLVLAYLNVYGLSPWGLDDYTRTVGRVFEPTVAIGFGIKTVLFGLAVAVIPAAAILEIQRFGRDRFHHAARRGAPAVRAVCDRSGVACGQIFLKELPA